MPAAELALAETVRLEGASLLAGLIRWCGNFGVAEEAVQEAALAALRDWPRIPAAVTAP